MTDLLDRLRGLTPEKRRLLEMRLRASRDAGPGTLAARERTGEPLPVSFSQQRLWLVDQMSPGTPVYNMAAPRRIRGPLDVAALERALDALRSRHESLRTTFAVRDGEPVQVIHPFAPVPLAIDDLSHLDRDAREAEALARAREDMLAPFDLSRGPLFRARLLRLGAEEHALLLSMHHVISDAWSIGILQGELDALYSAFAADAPDPLPALPLQYADYAAWQREWLSGERLEREAAWWRDRLAGAPPALDLPTDRPRPAAPSGRGEPVHVVVPPPIVEAVRALALEEGTTLFAALLGAWRIVLARHAGQDDVVIGTTVAGRSHADLEGLVGFFVNSLPLRGDLTGDPTFRQLVRREREATLDAFQHQELPFERVVEELRLPRDLSRTPVFQAMFSLQNAPMGEPTLSGTGIEPLGLEAETSRFDLSLDATESRGMLVLRLLYAADLFDRDTATAMLLRFVRLLGKAASEPDRRLSAHSLLDEDERWRVVREWNRTELAIDREATLDSLFAAQAARTPHATAVADLSGDVTFRELDERANRLAHALRARGVGPESRVGLLMERGAEQIVAVLAVLKAGGAYLPLDPEHPDERIAGVLRDAGASVVLTRAGLRTRAATVGTDVLCLDGDGEEIASFPATRPEGGATAETLAYVLYTSGSTGAPKGVAIRHRAVVNLLSALRRVAYANVERPLRVTLNGPLTFDTSVKQLVQLLDGHALVIVPQEVRYSGAALRDHLRRMRADVLDCTPGQLRLLLDDAGDEPLGPTRVLVGGEAISPALWTALSAREGEAFFNVYGPTETTVDATAVRIGAEHATPILGGPVANVTAYVVDGRMQPVPAGLPGELLVGGEGVARGYLNRPGLTAERFVPDPFGAAGARLYRTGDRMRWREDGTLEFLGRMDFQVKVRGFRIELGEIEARLAAHPAVRQAVAVVRGEGVDARLVAYAAADGDTSPADLRAHLRDGLPPYMVPASVVVLDALPLTRNGKVDRAALPAPEAAAAAPSAPPETATEEAVARIWAEVLGAAQVGAEENFFELGGHSLLAARVVSRLRESLSVEVPLRTLFEAPTVRQLAERVDSLAGSGDGAPPLVPADRSKPLPLSFAQERLWFLDQMDPGSPVYNVPHAVELRGAVDVAALDRALAEVVRRHEALRTAFVAGEDGPVQRILPPDSFSVTHVDVSGAEDPEAEAARLTAEESRGSFDLAAGPLLRATIFRLADDRHVLLSVAHHTASDAWSTGVLFGEVTTLYAAFSRGEPSPLPELPIQYADFSAWQRAWLEGEALEQQTAWWRERLAGVPATLELPTDRPRPAVQDLRGANYRFMLSPEAAEGARQLARTEGATLFMVLLAAFGAVLHRWSGQDDLVVGTPILNRPRPELERLVGFFSNTLALRMRTEDGLTFRDFLGRVRETTLGAYAHQDLPFERLVDALGVERSLSHAPLFQVMFTLQNAPPAGLTVGDAGLGAWKAEQGTSKFDMTMGMVEAGDAILGGFEFAAALWDVETVARMGEHLDVLLRAASADPATVVSALPLMADREREAVTHAFNDTARAEEDVSVHGLFARTAARTPDAVAVESDGAAWTYAQVDARADRIARRLRALGVSADSRVAVSLERSLDLPVAVLAVLRAGAGYVAVDPAYPADRVAYMLEDSRAAALVTTSDVAARLPESATPVLLLDALDGADAEDTDRPLADSGAPASADGDRAVAGGEGSTSADADASSAESARIESTEDDAAVAGDGFHHPESLTYVLYTSGSTGRPKGAALPHRALVNLIQWQLDRWGTDAAARTLQFASLSFDVSFQEIFATWAAGGTLVMIGEEPRRDAEALLDHLRTHGVERLFLPFAALQNLAEAAEHADARLPRLREIVTAGEALRATPQLRAFFAANPGLRLDNQYGPSETHVVTAFAVEGEPEAWPLLPPIGGPVDNTRMYVLDRRLSPVPVGVPGELYVAGSGLARGYLGRPGMTAEKFVPDPFGAAGSRLYRTGDRARWLPEGELEYLGRTDLQVKVRGFRVEPGEIEAAVGEHPGVREAAVAVRGEGAEKRIVAYLVPAGDARPTPSELRAHVAARLPEHMVPAAWVTLDAMPLTPSGKVDRRSLPEPDEAAVAAGRVAPRTPAEELVAAIWERVLGIAPGAHDNFFDLGGHSLRATQVISRVREAFGVDLPLRALFESPTVAGLASRAASARAGRTFLPPPLVPAGRDRPLPLSFAQQRFWFVSRMAGARAAYTIPVALRLGGDLDADALSAALDALVSRHESLRTVFRTEDGEPRQVILPATGVPLPFLDLGELEVAEREAEARRLGEVEARTPFDLEAGPLFRARLLRLAENEHVLLMAMHHIVSDGWSLGVLFRELSILYGAARDGRPAQLPPLPAQYADYAVWQRERLDGPALERDLAFWKRRLEGAPALAVPTDRPHPPLPSFGGAHVAVPFTPELSAGIAALARQHGATPFMVLLAAFSTLLGRWSGADDVVIGSPIAGRTPEETEGMIGVFLNTLALRTSLAGDPTFAALLGRVREDTLDAYAHQEVPFERLVEELKVERSLARHPLFQVLFSMQPGGGGKGGAFGGLEMSAAEPETGTAKMDLTLSIVEGANGFGGLLKYATDVFDGETIRRMAAQFATLLASAVARPESPVSALAVETEEERQVALEGWNRTEAPVPAGRVHEWVQAVAERDPDAVAIRSEDGALTYGQLNAWANRISHRLIAMGAGPERRVGVVLDRSAALVAAELAVLKAGAAYVPADPSAPAERTAHILADAGVCAVLTRTALRDRAVAADAPVMALDETDLSGEAEANPDVPVDSGHPAYVIYTSGSTGRPKGVVIPHGGLANLVAWHRRAYGPGAKDRSTLLASPAFDASAWETWPVLASGAVLCVMPDALRTDPAGLARWLETEGITLAFLPTPAAEAVLESMEREARRPPALRALLTGGDALRRRAPEGITLVNHYGPTENSVVSTWSEVPPHGDRLPAIGRAIDNQRAYVLDRRLIPSGVGVPGTLFMAGEGLARGYLGRPGATAEKFLPDPFAATPGARMYDTGDRVRWRADGELEFLGRVDDQVKVRGFRVEPGEIEAALLAHDAVSQAAVVVQPHRGGPRLVAYVQPASGVDADEAELRAHLRGRLPDYMVPSRFVTMDELPLLPSGKVDRRALPLPEDEGPRAVSVPKSATERTIASVWAEVLGVAAVGVDDNFFEIGGHSLLVARVQERLQAALGREVSIVELFQHATVRALAAHLDPRPSTAAPTPAPDDEGHDRGAARRERMRRRR